MVARRLFAAAVLLLLVAGNARAEAACDAPAAVCAARGAVYAISSFDPLASAVLVAPDLLVTNRHVVADQTRVVVHGKDSAALAGTRPSATCRSPIRRPGRASRPSRSFLRLVGIDAKSTRKRKYRESFCDKVLRHLTC